MNVKEKSVDKCWINVSATVGIMFFYSSSMWIDGVFFGDDNPRYPVVLQDK